MPRPEQVRPRASEDAEHGATALLEDLLAAQPIDGDERPSFAALGEGAPDMDGMSIFPDEDLEGPLEDRDPDGLDDLVFESPTLFADQPMEDGLSFGPGSSFVRRPPESDRDFKTRIARELRDSPASSRLVRDFADRLDRGE